MGAPMFCQFGNNGLATATVVTPNLTRDGSGSPAPVSILNPLTTGGCRIEGVGFAFRGANQACVIRLFVCKGSTRRLLAELEVGAKAPTSIQAGSKALWLPRVVFVLEKASSLEFTSTDVTSPLDAIVYGGDL